MAPQYPFNLLSSFQEFTSNGVRHEKIFCAGHVIPDKPTVNRYWGIVFFFWLSRLKVVSKRRQCIARRQIDRLADTDADGGTKECARCHTTRDYDPPERLLRHVVVCCYYFSSLDSSANLASFYFYFFFSILFHCRKREREKLRVEPARRGATGRTRKRHPSPSVMTRRGGEGSFYISLVHTNIPPSSTPTLVLLLFYSSFSVCPVSVPRDLFFLYCGIFPTRQHNQSVRRLIQFSLDVFYFQPFF